ncbi:MAG: LAGLIDADG family homing endonuclease [bacterium]|nr:LAGLIDADG family homing endonuclease [bacterium]
MAYVLGFWFADGYMRQDRSYRIVFVSNDKQILSDIRNAASSSNPIIKSSSDNSWSLIFYSKYLYKKLEILGGLRCKSKVITFPSVPHRYLPDFIRGYFDGDGSVFYVHYISSKNNKPRIELRSNFTSGSRLFLLRLMRILNKEIGLATKTLGSYNDGRSLKLGYATRDTQDLLKFMYYPGFSVGLKRKALFLTNL